MSTAKARRSAPAVAVPAARKPPLRLATSADEGTLSEAALLQSYIGAEFGEPVGPRPLPRAISVPLTIVVAAGLWWGLFAGAKALFRF
jgi:hypothetical protein